MHKGNGYQAVNSSSNRKVSKCGVQCLDRYHREPQQRWIEVMEHFPFNVRHQPFKGEDSIPDYNRIIKIDREDIDSWPHNYCEICHFIRPIRAKHCFQCGRCVARFDHHCPLVANCIGARNYKHFMCFLFTQSWLVCWALYYATE